jgi:hypothetical protein
MLMSLLSLRISHSPTICYLQFSARSLLEKALESLDDLYREAKTNCTSLYCDDYILLL